MSKSVTLKGKLLATGAIKVGNTFLHETLWAFDGQEVVITIEHRRPVITLSGASATTKAEGTNQ